MQVFEDICPPLYQDTDPMRLPMSTTARRRILEWQYGPRGLLVHGPTGSGKTRAVWLLCRRLMGEGIRVTAFDCMEFGHRAVQVSKESGYEIKDWVANLARWDVLFFDDIGKMKMTEFVQSELFGLIEKRIAACKPTLITTNLTGKALEKLLSPDRAGPLVRRLREYFEDVPVSMKEKT